MLGRERNIDVYTEWVTWMADNLRTFMPDTCLY